MRVLISALFLTIFTLQPVYSQETATVITEGIGRDVESAVQRGAEAALTQVVGSFVDSNKLIEKRKEIRNGIKTQTKSISSKISEYSQGSIERLDVLDVTEEDGLTRVTTKVTVRIEDFKHYIKETVLAEKKIQRGLLAELKTGRKQEKNLADLIINKVLRPVVDYQVVVLKLGRISKVTNSKAISWVIKATASDSETTLIERGFKLSFKGFVLSFDVDVKLNQDYLQNALRVLGETAEKKYSCHSFERESHKPAVASAFIGMGEGTEIIPRNRSCNLLASAAIESAPSEIYGFPMRHTQLCEKLSELFRINESWSAGQSGRVVKPILKMQFISKNGEVVREEIFNKKSHGYRKTLLSRFSVVLPRKRDKPFQLFTSSALVGYHYPAPYNPKGTTCSFFIKKSAAFRIFTKVTEELLGKADKIVLVFKQ